MMPPSAQSRRTQQRSWASRVGPCRAHRAQDLQGVSQGRFSTDLRIHRRAHWSRADRKLDSRSHAQCHFEHVNPPQRQAWPHARGIRSNRFHCQRRHLLRTWTDARTDRQAARAAQKAQGRERERNVMSHASPSGVETFGGGVAECPICRQIERGDSRARTPRCDDKRRAASSFHKPVQPDDIRRPR